jgi:hypothetical protein
MSDWNQPFVIDGAAYKERLKALLREGVAHTRAVDVATDHAYKTPFSLAATAAIRGDWEPARTLCREKRSEHGEAKARELMRSIQAAAREKAEMWSGPPPTRDKPTR